MESSYLKEIFSVANIQVLLWLAKYGMFAKFWWKECAKVPILSVDSFVHEYFKGSLISGGIFTLFILKINVADH